MKRHILLGGIAAALLTIPVFAENLKLPFTLEPQTARKIQIGKKPVMTLTPENMEIIVDKSDSPAAKFAAQEAADALNMVFGSKLKVQNAPSGKKTELRIGDRKLAKELGIDIAAFDRDGFIIRTVGNNKILIIGRDDFRRDPRRSQYYNGLKGEWATLFGTYDFLERFAGVRYYFTGPLGVHAPKAKKLDIPSIDIYDRPDNLQRRLSDANHSMRPRRSYPGYDGALNRLRNRMETVYIPNCHGLNYLGYYYRFGKSHPEYFALNADGTRMKQLRDGRDSSQLCFSSGIKQEIIADCLSFLKNESPKVRGIRTMRNESNWNGVHVPGLPCFNIMPNDSAYLCRCPECWKHFSKGKQATSDYIWQFFSDICAAVKKSGIPGYLTTMAYADYRIIPTQKIPDNLLVMLAIRGPWNEYLPVNRDADVEMLKAWCKKLGGKTWLWTYPGKYYGNLPGVPHSTPRSYGTFFKRVRPYIFGAFIECDSDVVMFNYLNHYVFGKLMWNVDTDVEKILAEQARDLYGAAAAPMTDFFDSVERHWKRIAANVVETSEGPKTIYPSELVLWNEIYTPAEIKRLSGLFDKAEKLVANDKLRLARVKLMRNEFFQPLLDAAEKFMRANDSVKAWAFPFQKAAAPVKLTGNLSDPAWKNASTFILPGLKGSPAEVRTVVRALYDDKYFYFGFECDEPQMAKNSAFVRPFDNQELWKDSTAEIFLSPDGDRQHYYQWMINAKGSWADLEVQKGAELYSWNSKAEIKTAAAAGKWYAEIRVPRKSMRKASADGVLINFARHRNLKDAKVKTEYYCWSPFARDFGDVSRFGKLIFNAGTPPRNLLDNPEFDPAQKKTGRWWGSRMVWDNEQFVTGGTSIRLDGGDHAATLIQYFKELKPDTDYEVQFFLKMDNVKKMTGDWSGFYVRFDFACKKCTYFPTYPVQMDGSCPWTALTFRVHTPKETNSIKYPTSYINFCLRKATGTVWIDKVSLLEIKK